MPTVLGFDLATKTGWSVVKDREILASGVQDFSKKRGESNGLLFLRARKWMHELISQLQERPLVAGYERAHFRGGAATEICVGLQTHLQGVCAEVGVESLPIETKTLKKWACGKGNAGKDVMMAKAREHLGRDPIDDNEADAVHVSRWAYDEFVISQ